jgi:hypothetical protein
MELKETYICCDSCDFSFHTSKKNIDSMYEYAEHTRGKKNYNWDCLACPEGILHQAYKKMLNEKNKFKRILRLH